MPITIDELFKLIESNPSIDIFSQALDEYLKISGNTINDYKVYGNIPKVNLLQHAISMSRTDILKLLLERGACVNAKLSWGLLTILMWASINTNIEKSIETIELLLEKDATLLDQENNNKETALIYSVQSLCNVKIVKLLLARGANIHHQDKQNKTALYWAISWGKIEITQVLLEHGAELDANIVKSFNLDLNTNDTVSGNNTVTIDTEKTRNKFLFSVFKNAQRTIPQNLSNIAGLNFSKYNFRLRRRAKTTGRELGKTSLPLDPCRIIKHYLYTTSSSSELNTIFEQAFQATRPLKTEVDKPTQKQSVRLAR